MSAERSNPKRDQFRNLSRLPLRSTEPLRSQLLAVAAQYGYQHMDMPIVEASDIYLLKAGETFATQLCELASRRRLSLRPEHTASVVRYIAEQVKDADAPMRISYVGPVFRRSEEFAEPQQLIEIGIELFGLPGLAGELELLTLASRFMDELRLQEYQPRIGQVGIIQRFLDSQGLDRRLSSFLLMHRQVIRDEGSIAILELLREQLPEFYDTATETNGREERKQLRELLEPLKDEEARAVLADFLSLTQLVEDANGPDEDDVDRLLTKLRRADSSAQVRTAIGFIEELAQLVGEPKEVISEARCLLERYGQDSADLDVLETIVTYLSAAGNEPKNGWHLDLGLSRGLHYYSGLIFEIFHGEGNGWQRLGGGGRYDGLTELFGGVSTPACGFSFSLERLAQAQFGEGVFEAGGVEPHPLVVSEVDWAQALPWVEKMRAAGCAIVMIPQKSDVDADCILMQLESGGPRFCWIATGGPVETLDWDETLTRLQGMRERMDD